MQPKNNSSNYFLIFLAVLGFFMTTKLAAAAEITAAEVQTNLNFVWTTVAAALVFFMQAGFLMLEAGMVRSKNSINVAQKNIADFIISVVAFGAVGFMIMFGTSFGGIYGLDKDLFMFNELPDWTLTFFIFQAVFCGTAATIVSGAVAERTSFDAYLYMALIIAVLIYPVFGHLAWGNLLIAENEPYLAAKGFIDYAGSTVVHSVGAWVALAAIIVIGPRLGRFDADGNPVKIVGHSPVLATCGAIILWVGWIGFNGGSTTAGTPDFAHIISNTVLSGAFGGLGSMLLGRFHDGVFRPDRSINGTLAGLVAITAGCDAVTTWGAMSMGFIGGLIAYAGAEFLERKLKVDDAIGAIPVHGFAGAWGTVSLAFFAPIENLATGGRFSQFLVQFEGVVIAFVWAFGVAWICLKIIDSVHPLRVSREYEEEGLNTAEHAVTLGTGELQKALLELIKGEGNLANRLDESTGDEAGELAMAFNRLLHNLQGMTSGIASQAERLSQHSTKLGTVAGNLKTGATQTHTGIMHINDEASAVTSHAEDMRRAVSFVDDEVHKTAENSARMAQHMNETMDLTTGKFLELIGNIKSSTQQAHGVAENAMEKMSTAGSTIDQLDVVTSDITDVLEVINTIADQTKLLSLNATIESERAGDAGKGFAVVASEVKRLAESTGTATRDIEQRVHAMRSQTADAVMTMREVATIIESLNTLIIDINKMVGDQDQLSGEMTRKLQEAADTVNQISSAMTGLADTATDVSEKVDHTVKSTSSVLSVMEDIGNQSQRSSSYASEVENASSEMQNIVETLKDSTRKLGK